MWAREMVPLLATLPGNDEFPQAIFDGFFEELQRSRYKKYVKDKQHAYLQMLVRWLANQRSPELALKEVSSWSFGQWSAWVAPRLWMEVYIFPLYGTQ